jgi:acyl-CoA thioesterase
MRFSDLMRSIWRDAGASSVEVPEDWLQGRSVFGGLQVALVVDAMRALVPATVPLRTLQVTFVAPVPAGTMRAAARVLRTGKSATHVEGRLADGDLALATAIGVFGIARPSAIARAPRRPDVAAHRPCEFPYVPGFSPAFTQHFDARWVRGGVPFSGDPSHEMAVELDFRDAGPASEAHVIALADYVPPVALSMVARPTPGSSLTWMLELTADRFDTWPLQGWRADVEMVAARDGYTSQSTLVWAPDGALVAISRQSMVVFG